MASLSVDSTRHDELSITLVISPRELRRAASIIPALVTPSSSLRAELRSAALAYRTAKARSERMNATAEAFLDSRPVGPDGKHTPEDWQAISDFEDNVSDPVHDAASKAHERLCDVLRAADVSVVILDGMAFMGNQACDIDDTGAICWPVSRMINLDE